ncbi:unnamed protein product [Notodromas monacha]|uniref:YEATS domain-containing protein n=1 Tax=Notodromas monacha TaxID=399045 RepID=A0A7R9BHX6_9CRUS|nr:unnamed protein product [Notodromas monacha]CAG0915815.1 unnamed protein product [Notodromas monacha]
MAGKQNVQVRILLGHTVKKRAFPSSEGYTHDWTVFVRGDVDVNLSCFVEKVIFTIHPSFPRPKRVVKEPPYELSESGYAGFLLKIELVFKTSLEPRSAKFDLDLFFNSDPSMDANSIRPEKLTFQKPGEDFKRKLLPGGGLPAEGLVVVVVDLEIIAVVTTRGVSSTSRVTRMKSRQLRIHHVTTPLFGVKPYEVKQSQFLTAFLHSVSSMHSHLHQTRPK